MNQQSPGPIVVLLFLVFFLIIMLVAALSLAIIFRPWLRAFLSGAPISVFQLLGMRLRGVPASLVVDAVITLVHRGHSEISRLCAQAESTYLAQRGLIQSPEQLADMVEKQLKAAPSP